MFFFYRRRHLVFPIVWLLMCAKGLGISDATVDTKDTFDLQDPNSTRPTDDLRQQTINFCGSSITAG